MMMPVVTSQCVSCGADNYGTRFCESCGTAVAPATEREGRGGRRLVILISAIVAGAVLLFAVVAFAATGLIAEQANPGAAPKPTVAAPDRAAAAGSEALEASPEPELVPAANSKPSVPPGCDALYSSAMVAQLESYDVVLNPSWARSELADVYSFDDLLLVELMRERSNLQCLWVSPNGGSGVGIETRIIPVTVDEGSAVQARLLELGYDSVDELGGTRYLFGVSSSETSAAYGESHIVVGGYWFATSWLELGVNGYTADMVTTLLG